MNRFHILIRHIRDETLFLITYTDGVSVDDFMENIPMQKAVLQSLMVIGEAANQAKEFWDEYPDIDWKGMAGLRHRLIHQYFAVNLNVVWEILTDDLPVLHEKILQLCNVCNDIE